MHRPSAEATRIEGVAAVRIALSDGDSWGFALPGPRLIPVVDPRLPDRVEFSRSVAYPLAVERLWRRVVDSCAAADPGGQFDAFLALAVALLRLAHDVDDARARALLDPSRLDLGRVAGRLIPAAFPAAADLLSAP